MAWRFPEEKNPFFQNTSFHELSAFAAGTECPLPPGYIKRAIVGKNFIIEYCHHGKGVLTVNQKSIVIEEGQCYVTFPDCVFTAAADLYDPWAMTWTHIRGANVQFYLENMGITPENPVFSWRGRREILACMHELRPLVQDTSKSQRVTAFTQSMCGHRLFSLLAAACDEQQADSHALPQQEKYVRQAMRFIDNSVDVITIQDVAAHVGLHRSYLSTLFHRYTGKSPQEYLIDHRMKRACALFANPFSTTSNVAYSLGYDPSTFCRVFRQVTGMTPMQYKASLRKKL